MEFKKRIDAFITLGKYLNNLADAYESTDDKPTSSSWGQAILTLQRAKVENSWFTTNKITYALRSWAQALTEDNLLAWTSRYQFPSQTTPKTVSVIMAANIPLDGFHDFPSGLISGYKITVKLSTYVRILVPFMSYFLIQQ